MDMLVTTIAQAQQPGSDPGGLLGVLPMFAIVFAIMYLLVLRPQQKKESERQEMLKKLQKNDKVITTGGIYGIVTSVKEDEVTLKVDDSQNVRIRFARSAIAGIIGEDGEVPPVGEDRAKNN
jgi:preprotein translocase subunit YajC